MYIFQARVQSDDGRWMKGSTSNDRDTLREAIFILGLWCGSMTARGEEYKRGAVFRINHKTGEESICFAVDEDLAEEVL